MPSSTSSCQTARSTPPPNLTSLPLHLLSQIAADLDGPSAAAFARVSPICTSSAVYGLWRSLNLSLNPAHGEYPLIQPHPSDAGDAFDAWASDVGEEAEERHRAALKAKMKTISMEADKRKWGLVRHIAMTPRPGSVFGMLHILDMCSEMLVGLDIRAVPPKEYEEGWESAYGETFDEQLLQLGFAGLSFPGLRKLRLREGASASVSTLPILLASAPQLADLDLEFSPVKTNECFDDPAGTRSFKIRNLRLTFVRQDEGAETPLTHIRWIAQFSPYLRQLSFLYRNGPSPQSAAIYRFFDSITEEFPYLQDLHWRDLPETFPADAILRDILYLSLRRLVFDGSHWTNIMLHLPTLRHLEELYLTVDADERQSLLCAKAALIKPVPCIQGLLPDLARRLRGSPKLCIIRTTTLPDQDLDYFSQLDSFPHTDVARIGSFRHKGEELLYARFNLPFLQIGDIPWHEGRSVFTESGRCIPYEDAQGDLRAKVFVAQPVSRWQLFTDYRGLMVPMAICETMRAIEGLGYEVWEKRGVEVGKTAWDVLTEWHADQVRGIEG